MCTFLRAYTQILSTCNDQWSHIHKLFDMVFLIAGSCFWHYISKTRNCLICQSLVGWEHPWLNDQQVDPETISVLWHTKVIVQKVKCSKDFCLDLQLQTWHPSSFKLFSPESSDLLVEAQHRSAVILLCFFFGFSFSLAQHLQVDTCTTQICVDICTITWVRSSKRASHHTL